MGSYMTRGVLLVLLACFPVMPAQAADNPLLTLNLQDVPLREALQVLADELELNLVLSDDVAGQVSVHVEQLDLRQTLDVMLFGRDLAFRLSHNLLAVGAPHHLQALDQGRHQRLLSDALVYTEYMQLNYADALSVLDLLTGSAPGSASDSAPGSASLPAASSAGVLSGSGFARVDTRTNTLIVSDTADRLQAIRDMLSVLDVPVRQVLIEAKIVSAALETGRELGVRWGLGNVSFDDEAAAALPHDINLTLAADHQSASFARFAVLRDQRLLDLEISALERAGQAELIARPRVTTQDNMPALIQSGVRIPYQAQAGGTAGGSTTEFVDALLSLDVTPLITPDERIIMRLHIRQDSVASGSGDVPAINTNTITTSVLVNNGDTLVLGGIFREEQTGAETGTPVLRHIPLLGALFRRQVSSQHRTELLIFITPEVVAEHRGATNASVRQTP